MNRLVFWPCAISTTLNSSTFAFSKSPVSVVRFSLFETKQVNRPCSVDKVNPAFVVAMPN